MYLIADKNIKGQALFEGAHAMTKSVGLLKTGLLRFRHGIYLVLMLAIGIGFTLMVKSPIGNSYLCYPFALMYAMILFTRLTHGLARWLPQARVQTEL